jgi:putative phosphoribosyl transferase
MTESRKEFYMVLFRDRSEAGRVLADKLAAYRGAGGVVVLGLPRGGVEVAFEVARALESPLDVLVVRKLGLPEQPELAMGAIASGGVLVLNQELVYSLDIPDAVIDQVAARERPELQRRERLYRGDRPPLDLRGKTVILVDDGLATGSTMKAAVAAVRHYNPAKVVAAVPVGAVDSCRELGEMADGCICVETPSPFYGVGLWYRNFSQSTDAEVQHFLDLASSEPSPQRPGP